MSEIFVYYTRVEIDNKGNKKTERVKEKVSYDDVKPCSKRIIRELTNRVNDFKPNKVVRLKNPFVKEF